ncbi:MAG: molecular chaperone HtpG [Myxococcales bacterium]|nr:molecular chaperone HtpG [Myxococcales bacterium]
MSERQTHAFQAEVSQVLHLVVNSLYSHKEIFLRELVSNASDALDKLRFRALSEKDLLGADEALKIRISADEAAGTLTVSDNGVGMSHDELVANLGTIARSGTREFAEQLRKAQEAKAEGAQLIGQFGVGFYSAFLVADRVEVISRAAGSDEAFRWESDAKESFSVEPAERAERGTTVVLHLKEDQKQFSNPSVLREVIRKHSDYVGHPIELETKDEAKEEPRVEVINQARALWQRPASEVSEAQYQEFYKHLSHDWENPLAWRHFHIEGTQMFSGIVFIPETPRGELLDPRAEHGVRLHVRRVLVMENCEELLPKWLRFVRGVVDSEDLPLNVSRETLQDSRAVRIIRKQLVTQVLGLLEELAIERPDDYAKFWSTFGPVLKEGLHFEPELRDRLARLFRYHSTGRGDGAEASNDSGWTSLAEYVARMPEGQPAIYYVEGSSREILAASPHLEQLRKRGYEVLLLVDPIDPFVIENLKEFEGKKLVNAMTEKLALDANEEAAPEGDALTERFKKVLGERVGDVRNSRRLDQSPVCLVTPEGGLQPHVLAMLRAQKLQVPPTRRILEVNPEHPVISNLRKLLLVKPDSPELDEWIEVLHDQALIAEGSPVDEPAKVAQRLTRLLGSVAEQAVRG